MTSLRNSAAANNALGAQFLCHGAHAFYSQVPLKNPSDDLCFSRIDHQFLVEEVIAIWRIASDEHSALPYCAELIFQSVRRDFTLKLSESEQHIEDQPTRRVARV